MNRFSDLNIKRPNQALLGDKIKIDRVLNQEIKVLGYRISKSQYSKNKSGMCLSLQVEFAGEKRVIFTGSDVLQTIIKQIPEDKFPFLTTIVKEGESLIFS